MPEYETNYRSVVVLTAFDHAGNIVERMYLSYEDFYEESPSLIDDDQYRAQRGIRRLHGEIYDSDGLLQSRFENYYNERGNYERGRAVHADGTVTED